MDGGFRPGDCVVVTGAGGLLGTEVVAQCGERPVVGRVVAVLRGGELPWDAAGQPRHVGSVRGDLGVRETWERLPANVTHVVHLAATIDPPAQGGDAALIQANVTPTAWLVECAARWPALRSVVYASSVSVYGEVAGVVTEATTTQPAMAYAGAKLANEMLLSTLRARGVRVACLRYGSLYGAGMRRMSVLPRMVAAARERGEIRVFGTGQRVQDFLHVTDAARAALRAAEVAADGVFNIGSGRAVSMQELAEQIRHVISHDAARVFFERAADEAGGGYRMDVRHARAELGFTPRISLAAGLERMGVLVGAM